MSKIPEQYQDILKKKTFAHLATVMPDGSPQVSPVWIDLEDGKVVVNTAAGRLKEKNIERDARVAISATDPENPYRAIMLRGRVAQTITGKEADDSIDRLAKKYLNADKYPFRAPNEQRVLYVVDVEKFASMG
jgi:PPOX class probable F420-dependent enzyme